MRPSQISLCQNTCVNIIGTNVFKKEDTLWYHLCVTNTDSSKLSETKQGDHEKSPKAFESNEMKHQHCWEVDVS